jgi:hypothetical protein
MASMRPHAAPGANTSAFVMKHSSLYQETLRLHLDRGLPHKTKEFWISAIVFVSKDENLTRFLG